MEKTMLQDEPGEKRKQILEDSCEQVEQVDYMKQFTLEDIEEMKTRLSDQMVALSKLEFELKEVKDDFKNRMKPIKDEVTALVENVKHQARAVTETCYKFVDHDNGQVGYYNEDGMLIKERPILPNERQTSIFTMESKTGTDDLN